MRYLGNKDSLLPFIDNVLAMHDFTSAPDAARCVCDPFTGTTSVARHLKRQGWRIVSGDNMAYSYAFQLLVCFAANRLKITPSQIAVEQLDAALVLAFLEPIAPGLKRGAFMTLLEQRIESATAELLP